MNIVSTTSLFIPVEYSFHHFSASVAGNDASAATFVFNCDINTQCGPVTVIQGSNTAIFSEKDQPITTVWNCQLYGTTSASCNVTSTSPGYSFPGTSTSTYPVASGYAFPLYPVDITAGAITGSLATPSSAQTSSSNLTGVISPATQTVSTSGSGISSGTVTITHPSNTNSAITSHSSLTQPSTSSVTATTTSVKSSAFENKTQRWAILIFVQFVFFGLLGS